MKISSVEIRLLRRDNATWLQKIQISKLWSFLFLNCWNQWYCQNSKVMVSIEMCEDKQVHPLTKIHICAYVYVYRHQIQGSFFNNSAWIATSSDYVHSHHLHTCMENMCTLVIRACRYTYRYCLWYKALKFPTCLVGYIYRHWSVPSRTCPYLQALWCLPI